MPQTDEFFYTPTTGFGVDARLESRGDRRCHCDALRLHGGVVVANPIRTEPVTLQEWVDAALAEAERAGAGKEVTPFLLAQMREVSGGATEEANRSSSTTTSGLPHAWPEPSRRVHVDAWISSVTSGNPARACSTRPEHQA